MTAARQFDAVSTSGPQLQVARGAERGTVFVLRPGATSVGRDPGAQLRLDDTSVSGEHAELRYADGQVVLHDRGSFTGTYVNREVVREAVLADGDEIWIGKFRFHFRAA